MPCITPYDRRSPVCVIHSMHRFITAALTNMHKDACTMHPPYAMHTLIFRFLQPVVIKGDQSPPSDTKHVVQCRMYAMTHRIHDMWAQTFRSGRGVFSFAGDVLTELMFSMSLQTAQLPGQSVHFWVLYTKTSLFSSRLCLWLFGFVHLASRCELALVNNAKNDFLTSFLVWSENI